MIERERDNYLHFKIYFIKFIFFILDGTNNQDLLDEEENFG
jgi:hypothetical protein